MQLKIILLLTTAAGAQQSDDLTQYVLPETGSISGNTFTVTLLKDHNRGQLAFGIAKLGPDVFTGSDAYSGFAPSGVVNGFSMMHESGTGGAPKYGVVMQMPFLGNASRAHSPVNDTRSAPDVTSVGYYKAFLGSNITVELSATSRAGFYQYTFPLAAQYNVVVDVSHILPSFRGQGLSQSYLGGNITVSETNYEGFGDYNNGWNRAPSWRIFFCGYFDTPAATVTTFVNRNGSESATYGTASTITSTGRVGAVFGFDNTLVTSRVGISFISSAKACQNVNSEIPAGTTLETLTTNVKQIWNQDVLSKVITTETDIVKLELLYTSMYHMHLLPSNRAGENPL